MKNLLCLSLLSVSGLFATTLKVGIHLNGQEYNFHETFEGTSTSFKITQDNVLFEVACVEQENADATKTIDYAVKITDGTEVVADDNIKSKKLGEAAHITTHDSNGNHEIKISIKAE